MKAVLLILFFVPYLLFSKENQSVIKGYAPSYVNQHISIFKYTDYLSEIKILVAESIVQADSTFALSFNNYVTGKYMIQAGDNHFFLYVEPDHSYDIYIHNKPINNDFRPAGNEVEFFFLGLDSLDINYKIIDFDNQLFGFIGNNYNRSSMSSSEFVQKLDGFKSFLSEKYKLDTSVYFENYVLYSLAAIDNMAFLGSRNKFEKYDFYIKNRKVDHFNDRYMEYILNYYDEYEGQLSQTINNAFYQGVVKESPSIILHALGKDYSLENVVLRELVMIKMLSDVYYKNSYPQTSIISILDSLSIKAIHPVHQYMAKNIKSRLTQLTPGSKMPDFEIQVGENKINQKSFNEKHLYIQFVKEGSAKSENDFELLNQLYTKYKEAIDILTIVESDNPSFKLNAYKNFNNITWDCVAVPSTHDVIKDFQVVTFPHYVLADSLGYIIAAPALSPRPNNEYDTIERSFFEIKKSKKELENSDNQIRNIRE